MKVGYYKDDLKLVDADTVNHAAETFEEVSHHHDIDVYDLHYDEWTELGGY